MKETREKSQQKSGEVRLEEITQTKSENGVACLNGGSPSSTYTHANMFSNSLGLATRCGDVEHAATRPVGEVAKLTL